MKLGFRIGNYFIDKPKKLLFTPQGSLFGSNVECQQLTKTAQRWKEFYQRLRNLHPKYY